MTNISSLALAALLLAGAATGCTDDGTSESQQGIKCQGINKCEGMSECAGPDGANDCQGKNKCEGMGWVTVETAQECTEKGGTVL
ncbi:MAG: hypothetical protein JNL83_10840 [Myxococcales bacterium]|nr:hypothetical protein [Myxococcales bacterium]